jgi:hypothetical protein
MVERFNKPTVKGVITSPQQAYLLNPGNNNILVNRLTTVAHITPTMATNLPPVQQASSAGRSVRVGTGRR